MLQQNILGEKSPYQLFVSEMGAFPAHRHADIEFSYCLEGEYEGIGNLVVGYPEGDMPAKKERREGRVVYVD